MQQMFDYQDEEGMATGTVQILEQN